MEYDDRHGPRLSSQKKRAVKAAKIPRLMMIEKNMDLGKDQNPTWTQIGQT